MTKHFLKLLFITALLWSCDDKDDEPDNGPSATPDADLVDIRDFTIKPAYLNALSSAGALQNSMLDFNINPTSENLDAVQSGLKTAWLAWQSASPFEFGPADDVSLRANVNTFPVDSFSVLQRIENQDFIIIANDTKGFPALDLLFNGIGNSDAEILGLYTGDDASDFIAYSQAVINDISEKLGAVKSSWDGSYGESFTTNTGFATGSSYSLFINAYVQDWEQIKRERIALPLGLLTFQTPLPERVECYYGSYSQELAMAHVQSHYSIYLSDGYMGIQELVEDITTFTGENGETLNEAIMAQFELSIQELSEVPDPLSETVLSDFDTVNEAYLALQDMVVLMKTDMTSGLGISINFADNDGD
ncbi:MAG: imelysin family protein [Flavobacteriales bacterium]